MRRGSLKIKPVRIRSAPAGDVLRCLAELLKKARIREAIEQGFERGVKPAELTKQGVINDILATIRLGFD